MGTSAATASRGGASFVSATATAGDPSLKKSPSPWAKVASTGVHSRPKPVPPLAIETARASLAKMTVLGRASSGSRIRPEWADAPIFVPGGEGDGVGDDVWGGGRGAGDDVWGGGSGDDGWDSIGKREALDALGEGTQQTTAKSFLLARERSNTDDPLNLLCPYAEQTGECTVEGCRYLHGDLCPCCQRCCILPNNPEHYSAHVDACVAAMESGLEQDANASRSAQMECGICMERVLEKPKLSERRWVLLFRDKGQNLFV